jgi:acetylglutamate synthase
MAVTKAEYEAALSQTLIDEKGQLTEAGIAVCDYGTDQGLNHPELDVEQLLSVIKEYFPRTLDVSLVEQAVTAYYAEMI